MLEHGCVAVGKYIRYIQGVVCHEVERHRGLQAKEMVIKVLIKAAWLLE